MRDFAKCPLSDAVISVRVLDLQIVKRNAFSYYFYANISNSFGAFVYQENSPGWIVGGQNIRPPFTPMTLGQLFHVFFSKFLGKAMLGVCRCEK